MFKKIGLLLTSFLLIIACKNNQAEVVSESDLDDFDLVDQVESVVETVRFFNDSGIIMDADPMNPEHFQTLLTFDPNGLLIERKIIKSNGHIHELYRYHGKDTVLSIDQFQNNELLFKTMYTYTAQGKLSKWVKKSVNDELIESREYRFKDGKVVAEIRKNPGMQHEIRFIYNANVLQSEERWTNQRRKSKTTYLYNDKNQKIKEVLIDANEKLMYTASFEYDNDRLVLEIYRNEQNEVIRKSTYAYNDEGHIIFQSKLENNIPEVIEQNIYNEQNQLVEQIVTENGTLIWQQNYTYDVKGKVIESLSFDGIKRELIAYQYEMDNKGNWINRTMLIDGKPKQIVSRKITYK